jgi:hypothetical protein
MARSRKITRARPIRRIKRTPAPRRATKVRRTNTRTATPRRKPVTARTANDRRRSQLARDRAKLANRRRLAFLKRRAILRRRKAGLKPSRVISDPRWPHGRPIYPGHWPRPPRVKHVHHYYGRKRHELLPRHDLQPYDNRPAHLGSKSNRVSVRWARAQVTNASRHLSRLTDFRRTDYGRGLAQPKEANVQAANALLSRERAKQLQRVRKLADAGKQVEVNPSTQRLTNFASLKDHVSRGTRKTEAIWHFYDNLFSQRLGPLADELAAMDRIALDCYQTCYMGLGRARSLPTPPPMAYMEPAAGPATYRRGVSVPKLSKLPNPYPLVRLPFHRLMNPWSLGAVPHEIGHNVHADLKLWTVTPTLIRRRLATLGFPSQTQAIWSKWHKEIYADLIGVLLLGPYYVESLLDVVGKSPARVARFKEGSVHPTSYVRPFISTALLRRIGFATLAAKYDAGWRGIYPASITRKLPPALWKNFPKAADGVVDVLCFKKMNAYGGKSLSQVVRFRPQDMVTIKEAAERLAKGTNPGIAPSRFFICAAREALDRRLASPRDISKNFYTALTGN